MIIDELKTVMGKTTSQNQSPTLRARLVKVGKTNCTFESVQSPYKQYPDIKVGVQYKVPNQFAWNAFFY